MLKTSRFHAFFTFPRPRHRPLFFHIRFGSNLCVFSKHCKNIAFSHAFLIWTQTLCVFFVGVSSLVGLRASRNAHFRSARCLQAFKTACFGCIWCFRMGQSARFGSVRSLRTSRNVCFGGVNIIWCLRTNENARFGGLRRIRISRNVWLAVSEAFGASGLSKHAFQMFCVPLNLLKFAFQMFSMRSKSPKRGLGTPLVFFVIFVPLGTCIREYSGSNPFSSIKFEALETHFRHLAQACPLILNHVSEMLFGISQAFFRLRKLKDTFGASRALARKLQFWISRC